MWPAPPTSAPPSIPLLRLCLYYACKLPLCPALPSTACGLILRPIFLVATNAARNCLVLSATLQAALSPHARPPSPSSPGTPSCCPVAQHFSNFHNNNRMRSGRAEVGQFLFAAFLARNFCSWRLWLWRWLWNSQRESAAGCISHTC